MIENIQQATSQDGFNTRAATTSEPAKDSLLLILGAVLIIVLLNFAAFSDSLHGYFLADDFAHVDYLKSVFNGNAHLLWKNFYSNWMQTLGTCFYRPLISITLASDYLFWGANPDGFHISNFLYQTLSSVFLFLSLLSMFPALDKRAKFSTALLTASLFACHPLHPEVVSWIIARVDSVCTTFLFLSLWLYLLSRHGARNRAGAMQVLSLIAFTMSLMSKEMAITLPPTLFIYELINSASSGSPTRKTDDHTGWRTGFAEAFKEALKEALKATKWHILLLLFYLGFRAVVLGTLFGGYSGSVGEGLKDSLFRRWFEGGSLTRLLLPFNDFVTESSNKIRLVFKLMTAAALVIAVVRAILTKRKTNEFPFSISPFLPLGLIWLVIALAPTVQVFDITAILQGGRFVYLATAPVVLIIASLIFGAGDEKKNHGHISLLPLLSTALAALFTMSYAFTARQNNQPWVEASRGVNNLRAGVEAALTGRPKHMKVALLNLPPHQKGAHMLYNASMFGVTLKPPLTKEDLSERIITFEPVTFGDANLIGRTRLRNLLADKNLAGVFVWDSTEQKLLPMKDWHSIALCAPRQTFELGEGNAVLEDANQIFQSPVIDAPSTDFDFLDVTLRAEPKDPNKKLPENAILVLGWAGATHPIYAQERESVQPLKTGENTYRFSVGELKSWVGEGKITGLTLNTSEKPCKITVKSVRFINADDEIPILSFAPGTKTYIDSNGTLYINKDLGPLIYDATKIRGAKYVRYEISRPESWFEHYTGTLRDKSPSDKAFVSGKLDQLGSTNAIISLKALKVPGYYEFRILAMDAQDKPLGYVSNPINFQVTPAYFKTKSAGTNGVLENK